MQTLQWCFLQMTELIGFTISMALYQVKTVCNICLNLCISNGPCIHIIKHFSELYFTVMPSCAIWYFGH